MENTKKLARQKKTSLALLIALVAMTAVAVTMSVMYAICLKNKNDTEIQLESVYQRNFTDLVDNVNNAEVKLSKILVSDYGPYTKKMLNEISKNATEASINMSSLPISINGIDDTIGFVNQVGGFTDSLANKLERGEELTAADKATLQNLHDSIEDLKTNLNRISQKLEVGSIYTNSMSLKGDYNDFTITLQGVKSGSVEYPVMIYDGPFSDSVINKKIKNLNGAEVTKDYALSKVLKAFSSLSDSSVEYLGETKGKFETYDFKGINSDGIVLYIQVTKKEGNILTVSGYSNTSNKKLSIDNAKTKAIEFAKACGVDKMMCVWSDTVENFAYINLAPTKNSVILYPDIILVKVDLESGEIIGYEASAYYTNHTERSIGAASVSKESAEAKVPSGYSIFETRLALAPLEHGKEILCQEITCYKNGNTFYIYVNAQTGEIENILRVVETDSGNLML